MFQKKKGKTEKIVSIIIGKILTEKNELVVGVINISVVINSKIKNSPYILLYLKTNITERIINPMKRTPPKMPEYKKEDIKILWGVSSPVSDLNSNP